MGILGIGIVAVISSELPSLVVRAPNSQKYRAFRNANSYFLFAIGSVSSGPKP